jgi:hypothetical protein
VFLDYTEKNAGELILEYIKSAACTKTNSFTVIYLKLSTNKLAEANNEKIIIILLSSLLGKIDC